MSILVIQVQYRLASTFGTSVAWVLKWFQTYSKLLRRFVWNVYVWRILHVVDVMKISYNQYLIYHISKYISRFSNYSEPPHTHSQKRTILVLSRCYATNFAYMCGALFEPSWEQENLLLTCKHDTSAFLFSVVLNSYEIHI